VTAVSSQAAQKRVRFGLGFLWKSLWDQ